MKDVLLSDLYWKLHRNSTISSFLLFLSSNKLIYVASLLGVNFVKNDYLVSFFLFVWATYAFAVFWFEGSREGARKSTEVREKSQKQIENFEKIYQQIGTDLTIIHARMEPVIGRMGQNIESLERKRAADSPTFADIRGQSMLISNDELALFQSCLKDEDNINALGKLKGSIADGMYARMSEILQHSQTDLSESLNGISGIVSGLTEQLHKAEGLLNTKRREISIRLSTDKIRVFLTGRSIPFVFYLLASVHFLGLYFSWAPSALDLLKRIHVF